MKKQNKNFYQAGVAHLALILIGVVALVGVLGFVGYNTWQKQDTDSANKQAAKSEQVASADTDAYLCTKSRNRQPSGHYSLVWTGKLYAKINGEKKAGPGLWKLFAGKGYWCAIAIAGSSTHAVNKPLSIKLTTDHLSSGSNLREVPEQPTQIKQQSGSYKYYAGPVYTKFHWMVGADSYAPYKISAAMTYRGIKYTGIRSSGVSKASNTKGFTVEQDPQRDY